MYKPNVVFLSETRQNKKVIEHVCVRLGFSRCWPVVVDGKGGGLALFWNDDVKVDLINYRQHHIDVKIEEVNGIKWRGTFVYGEARAQDRYHMWNLLKRIKPNSVDPWLMVGDFNEAMWQCEHFSASRRNEKQMSDFRDVLSFCNLHDLGFKGAPWTFNNKQKGNRNVKVRLDRAVACPRWMNLFEDVLLEHITSPRSDHSPILVTYGSLELRNHSSLGCRYEFMWEREASLPEQVELAWNSHASATDLGGISNKISATMTALHGWSKERFGSVSKELKELRLKLEELNLKDNNNNNFSEIQRTAARMDELLHREEIMWMQRSKISWLREGDRNTTFFHRKASARAKKNRITKLKLPDGTTTYSLEKMKSSAKDFFYHLFERDQSVNPEQLLNILDAKVMTEMNLDLTRDFLDNEIGDALF
jgi:hypothetical protein